MSKPLSNAQFREGIRAIAFTSGKTNGKQPALTPEQKLKAIEEWQEQIEQQIDKILRQLNEIDADLARLIAKNGGAK